MSGSKATGGDGLRKKEMGVNLRKRYLEATKILSFHLQIKLEGLLESHGITQLLYSLLELLTPYDAPATILVLLIHYLI